MVCRRFRRCQLMSCDGRDGQPGSARRKKFWQKFASPSAGQCAKTTGFPARRRAEASFGNRAGDRRRINKEETPGNRTDRTDGWGDCKPGLGFVGGGENEAGLEIGDLKFQRRTMWGQAVPTPIDRLAAYPTFFTDTPIDKTPPARRGPKAPAPGWWRWSQASCPSRRGWH